MNKRFIRNAEFLLIDLLVLAVLFWAGLFFIQGENPFTISNGMLLLLFFLAFKAIALVVFRLYNLVLDHVGTSEIFRVIIAVLVASVIFEVFTMAIGMGQIGIEMLVFLAPAEILMLTGIRFSKRVLNAFGIVRTSPARNKYIRTLIVGAGSAGKLAYDEILKNANLKNKVIAFIDDDKEKIGKRIGGLPIFGPIEAIGVQIQKHQIQEVIIAISNIDKDTLSTILELVSVNPVKVKRLPLILEEEYDEMRKLVDVKIEDLLNRGVVELDFKGLGNFIEHKVVLVTGGGGSIGSELCHQILNYNPKILVLFDIYENTTYQTQLDLKKRIQKEGKSTQLLVYIGSVYNYERLESLFKDYRPELVFHAAAYKHVPLMEDSAVESVRTNVIGTYNMIRLADIYQVEQFTLVSTDKAVRPTNIMGATKAIGECLIQYFGKKSTTKFSAVRFGNVLGSHGSVVPIFKKQIEEGGPVTITHPDITRFFMTISEAVGLILQSAMFAQGGEIFILDMGQPVKILDLAEKMIRLSGLTPNKDIKIEFCGLRPGEKLFEELLLDVDKNIKTANNKIFIERESNGCKIDEIIDCTNLRLDQLNNKDIKEIVAKLIVSYSIDNNVQVFCVSLLKENRYNDIMKKMEGYMKIYTKRGDAMMTDTVVKRVSKSDSIINVTGLVDEVQTSLMVARNFIDEVEIQTLFDGIARELFQVGYRISSKKEYDLTERIEMFERTIDYYTAKITPITDFILPGKTKQASLTHLARVTTRRFERALVSYAQEEEVCPNILKYVNRLSDLLYTIAVYVEEHYD